MANNPYVNKVELANGTTLIDLSSDTAVASDVAQGKYFHLATGERVQGTGSGSGSGGIVITDTTDSAGGTVRTITAVEISGTKQITSNGTGIDVTSYESVDVAVPSSSPNLQAKTNVNPTTSSQTIQPDSGYDGLSSVQINAMPSGTAGTPTATKGTVSNHQISVTPSVTNQTGYITGSTKTGTAVTVSASELVSGSETKTQNGTYDVTNLAELVVNVSGGSVTVDTKTMTNSSASNTSISFSGLGGTPKAFFVRCTTQLTRSSNSSYYYVVSIRHNGTNTTGNYWRMSNGTFYNDTSHYSYSYSNGTLTVSSSASRSSAGGSFYNGNYELVYVY